MMPQHRRGRRRGPRWISEIPQVRTFGPLDQPFTEIISLSYAELEALRLVDHEGMEQDEAAAMMGISKKSLWLELHSGRVKLAKALVEGALIQIEGGNYVLRARQPGGVRPRSSGDVEEKRD